MSKVQKQSIFYIQVYFAICSDIFNICSFVYQCNIHFLLFIIRRQKEQILSVKRMQQDANIQYSDIFSRIVC
jgi:hypothetical protein